MLTGNMVRLSHSLFTLGCFHQADEYGMPDLPDMEETNHMFALLSPNFHLMLTPFNRSVTTF